MANATKAGVTLEYGELEYELSPLGLRELEYLETYLQGRVIAAGRESIPEDASQEERDQLMRPIVTVAMSLSIMDGMGFNQLMNPAGIVRLFYVSLKRKTPTITLDICRKMIIDPEMSQQIKEAIELLNPNPKARAPKKPESEPTASVPETVALESSQSSAQSTELNPAK